MVSVSQSVNSPCRSVRVSLSFFSGLCTQREKLVLSGSHCAFPGPLAVSPPAIPAAANRRFRAQWTGFYRLEYGLWHGQSARQLTPPSRTPWPADARGLRAAWPSMQIDLIDMGLRTHEILENALQFQLTGHDDYGSGTTLATTGAKHRGHTRAAHRAAPDAGPRGTPGCPPYTPG